jgi:ABC-type multidrug transport system fused ATPase/permease subunit
MNEQILFSSSHFLLDLSLGQRQLLSLARAILRKCRIVLMDEVTASIDYTTDRMIQHTIRESPNLKSATIITVAHRLRTIADSDCITVVDSGRIIETGSPKELLQINSQFENLAKQSNEFDEIVRIAETKYGKIFKFSS